LKITDVLTFKLTGRIKHKGADFWEERLLRPVDIYPRFAREGPEVFGHKKASHGVLEIASVFVEIKTDGNVSGIAGPMGAPFGEVQARFINSVLRKVLIGEDPLAIERIWDQMYRYSVHGRKGEAMMAISAVDCALWDLRGKYEKVPVYRLLGGPTRERLPAYASMLGYSIKPELAAKRAAEMVAQGFGSMKWFVRQGPQDGIKGEEANVGLVKAIRDSVGYDVKLMLDAWMSWNVGYTIRMAKKLERYDIAWLEEPLMPDNLDGHAELARTLSIPIAGGEHEYTRWGFRQLLEKRALDVIQPDIMWAGGITECLKISALASSFDVPVIPHTGHMSSTLNLQFSQPSHLAPIAEYLVKWNLVNQHFYSTKFVPQAGHFMPPDTLGLGGAFSGSSVVKRDVVN
jgi:L-alanine-DL-glutamate epimerase-like enolase superfamily enzyme